MFEVVNADKGAVDVATLCSRITKVESVMSSLLVNDYLLGACLVFAGRFQAALRGNRVLATRAMLFQDKADLSDPKNRETA